MSQETYAFPLSFAQQRLWFLDQLAPGHAFYNIPAALRFSFPLNVPVLERCLNEIVRRHETLRTTFRIFDGEPAQVVAPFVERSLPVVDLRPLPPAERDAEALRLATEEARKPFDLTAGPLIRTTLLRLGEADYVFLLTLHHIVSDGWSMAVFSKELTALYTAFATGRPSPLPELPIQYADYALWQREFLEGEKLREELAWWGERLANLPILQFPTDRPRPPLVSYEGASLPFALPSPLSAGLRALAQREGVTLFLTLLAAFEALLHRYTGQDDLAIGVPIAGRDRTETEGLIGFFVNTLVLRARLSGDWTFREFLARLRPVVTEAFSHAHVPFERLVEEIQPQRDPSRNPLFQVVFQLFGKLAFAPLSSVVASTNLAVQRGASVFDLGVHLWESADALSGHIEYSTALFDPETIVRLASHFRTLLQAVVDYPDTPIARLPLLSAAERQQLVVEWNRTSTPYPRDRCVHELFEEIVRRTPDAIAVEFQTERLAYAELDTRANRLAHHLAGLGVGPETLVGVCLERSAETIVALLAILKAGGAYVPLDPQYPPARLQLMADDCQLPFVLGTESTAVQLPPARTATVLLDHDAAAIARHPGTALGRTTPAEALAYVIYTSGSTGRPKGTAVVHRGIIRLVRDTDYVTLGERDVLLQFAPISFDASTFEIWGALLNGARLVVFPPHTPSLDELGRFIADRGISVLWLTSSLFQQMVDGPIETLRQVRQWLAGGDVLPAQHVRKALSLLPDCCLINGYGPTENTTFTCCCPMTDPERVGHAVSIGRPIANTRVYILDRHREPVPIGVPGELFAGGDGLARGYLHRPELTAERFVPDPFDPTPGARLYRTGDLARFRPDGSIEFLGRVDQQVKVRGYRIELGEIEAVLRGSSRVKDVAVVLRQAEDGDKSLVAYVVEEGTGDADLPERVNGHPRPDLATDLRHFAQQRLPDFMVPSRVVLLPALPLNPNGKLDRAALPDSPALQGRTETFVAPRTDLEAGLAALWQDLLHVPAVGVNDDFFADLGGHSLRATQLASRLRDRFQVDLPLQAIFQAPTVAQLALVIEDRLLSELESPESPSASDPMPTATTLA